MASILGGTMAGASLDPGINIDTGRWAMGRWLLLLLLVTRRPPTGPSAWGGELLPIDGNCIDRMTCDPGRARGTAGERFAGTACSSSWLAAAASAAGFSAAPLTAFSATTGLSAETAVAPLAGLGENVLGAGFGGKASAAVASPAGGTTWCSWATGSVCLGGGSCGLGAIFGGAGLGGTGGRTLSCVVPVSSGLSGTVVMCRDVVLTCTSSNTRQQCQANPSARQNRTELVEIGVVQLGGKVKPGVSQALVHLNSATSITAYPSWAVDANDAWWCRSNSSNSMGSLIER